MRMGVLYSGKEGRGKVNTSVGAPRIYIGGTCGEVWSDMNVSGVRLGVALGLRVRPLCLARTG
jgi:hypothetical protein